MACGSLLVLAVCADAVAKSAAPGAGAAENNANAGAGAAARAPILGEELLDSSPVAEAAALQHILLHICCNAHMSLQCTCCWENG